MATVNFYLKKPNSNKETHIFLAFTVGEKRFKFYTEMKIHPNQWDKIGQKPKRSFIGAPELKTYMDNLQSEAMRVYNRFQSLNEPFTLDQVRDQLKVEYERKPTFVPLDLLPFIESHIEAIKDILRPSTIKGYRNSLTHLKNYQDYSRRKVNFENITLDFYTDFSNYLIQVKGFSVNTVGKQIKNLKKFLQEATERGINTKVDFKSKKFRVVSENSENIYLTEGEILNLYNLDLSQNKKLERVRDLFIVGCYTGLRFSDFSQIKPENITEEYISIRTQKTDEAVVIPIHKMVKEIMNKYALDYDNSLPPSISNQKMNEYLKEIGRKANLNEKILTSMRRQGKTVTTSTCKSELITTHTARRSFATNLYLAGFPSISLMKITGHKTEKAFLTYIKITPEENANKLKKFWNERTTLKAVN